MHNPNCPVAVDPRNESCDCANLEALQKMHEVTGVMTYEIQNSNNGEILATNLTTAQVEDWWRQHENEYFGIRVVDRIILVAEQP